MVEEKIKIMKKIKADGVPFFIVTILYIIYCLSYPNHNLDGLFTILLSVLLVLMTLANKFIFAMPYPAETLKIFGRTFNVDKGNMNMLLLTFASILFSLWKHSTSVLIVNICMMLYLLSFIGFDTTTEKGINK